MKGVVLGHVDRVMRGQATRCRVDVVVVASDVQGAALGALVEAVLPFLQSTLHDWLELLLVD